MFKVSDLKYRTQNELFDVLLSPQTILNSAQSFVLSKGEIADFYSSLQLLLLTSFFQGDVDCDAEGFSLSNPESESLNV
jgi:hypothetical protein